MSLFYAIPILFSTTLFAMEDPNNNSEQSSSSQYILDHPLRDYEPEDSRMESMSDLPSLSIDLNNLSPHTLHRIQHLINRSKKKNNIRHPLRILSLDGGGTRGVISITLLEEIERRANCPIYDLFDIIAGVSTGSLIVGALQKKKSAKQIIELYKNGAQSIFSQPNFHRGFYGPQYSAEPYQNILKDVLGQTTLGECSQDCLFVTYNHTLREQQIFNTRKQKSTLLYDTVLASSSAQTYFPPTTIDGHTIMDGGITTFNPSGIALDHACYEYGVTPEECIVVSLGTGYHVPTLTEVEAQSMGIIGWLNPLFSIMLNGASTHQSVHKRMHAYVKNPAYFRYQFKLPQDHYTTHRTDNLDYLEAQIKKSFPYFETKLQDTVDLLLNPDSLYDRLVYR